MEKPYLDWLNELIYCPNCDFTTHSKNLCLCKRTEEDSRQERIFWIARRILVRFRGHINNIDCANLSVEIDENMAALGASFNEIEDYYIEVMK